MSTYLKSIEDKKAAESAATLVGCFALIWTLLLMAGLALGVALLAKAVFS